MWIRRLSQFQVVAVALLGFVISQCSKDDKKPDEAVQASVDSPSGDQGLMEEAFQTEPVYFEFDSSRITSAGQNVLASLADHLKSSGANVQIEGHCDERGTAEYNLALGERRAKSVKRYLENLGVASGNLSTLSYGEEKPAVNGHDESAWSRNRRAEFVLNP